MSRLVNAKAILKKAYEGKYAIGHFNINNLEWTKAILLAAQETKTPVILGTSEGAVKYMGGFKTVYGMVDGLLEGLNITVPVVLHLDHGQTVESAKAAIDAGYTSVMFDGSHYSFEDNFNKTKEVVAYANERNVSVEAEIGSIGGEEDGVIGTGEIASPQEAEKIATLGIDMLAAGIGNIHGKYPESWKSLNFEALEALSKASKLPMVLHGGSGIPKNQVLKAISLGINKINVNTELQLSFAKATGEYVKAGKHEQGKGFDPRKLLAPGVEAIQATMLELAEQFGSKGKA